MTPSLNPPRSAMWRMVVPFMSPVSVKARRAACRMDLRRASAVSRRARGRPLALRDERGDCLAMGSSRLRRAPTYRTAVRERSHSHDHCAGSFGAAQAGDAVVDLVELDVARHHRAER